MSPFRPPFSVPARPGNPNTYRLNTTQPQPNFNLQDMDPHVFAYNLSNNGRFATVSSRYRSGDRNGTGDTTRARCLEIQT
ncbi:hypothetical protein Hanom_Chr01g00082731 [Helianthus anomalus]